MKSNYVIKLIAVLLCVVNIHCSMFDNNNGKYIIETSDIDRFWQAYDGLKQVHTFDDSVAVIQNQYLDKMSSYGEKFIDIRQYTAPEFVRTIRKYPRYLNGLRIKTTHLISHKAELDSTFDKLSKAIPRYRKPNVCFAIGCFRGGVQQKRT